MHGALKLTKDHWDKIKHPKTSTDVSQELPNSMGAGLVVSKKSEKKMIPSLWVNMTDTFMVADKMDEIFEEIVSEILIKMDAMHPVIYENLAWYYLKNEKIIEAIHYLEEAKKKGHPGFMAIKDSKYFQFLREYPEFLRLFEK